MNFSLMSSLFNRFLNVDGSGDLHIHEHGLYPGDVKQWADFV